MRLFKRKDKAVESGGRRPRLMEGQNDYVFRRSRTLTGSSSSKIATAESRRDLKSPRLKLHELHTHRRRLSLSLAGLAALTLLSLYAIGTSLATTSVSAEGNVVLTSQEASDLQARLRAFSTAYPGQMFTGLLDQPRLTAYLQQQYPEIASAYLARPAYLPANSLMIRFRTPLVAWNIDGQQLYIDADGAMFSRLHGAAPRLTVEDESGVRASDVATSVASKRFIRYLGQLLAALERQQPSPVERVVIPSSTRQLDLYLQGRAYPIKTHIDRHPEGQAIDIANALKFIDERQLTPEYVDVRVEGKAFYK